MFLILPRYAGEVAASDSKPSEGGFLDSQLSGGHKNNSIRDAVHIPKNVCRRHAINFKPLRRQPGFPNAIAMFSFIAVMMASVDLDDEFCANAVEIKNVRAIRILPPEYRHVGCSGFKPFPKQILRRSQGATHLPSLGVLGFHFNRLPSDF
ncbi:hypothetical protein ABAC460_06410 [Asticcacaulis sp. AC460]|nr:hypothetical protein ABAC460_06410 [Asticcacaulis sp. AC460]